MYKKCFLLLRTHFKNGCNLQLQFQFSTTKHKWLDGAQISATEAIARDKDSTSEPITRSLPVMTSRKLAYLPKHMKPRQAWLETLSSDDNTKLGLLDLHPDIFATAPRLDILWWNIYWQRLYRHIDYTWARSRAEMPQSNKKPWPQKGTGRARHGDLKSPIFHSGGKAHGPRGPKSYFFMLPRSMRALGLRVALSCKYAQDKLHIVELLDIPSDEPSYLEDLVESRGWGLSVLFIDDTDIMPRNISLATSQIKPYNIMPVYGLNVYSMLKHETLVLTLAAVEKLEEKLLLTMHHIDSKDKKFERNKDMY